jgi:cholesterol oxidase
MGTSNLLVRAKNNGDLPRLNDFVGKEWSTNGNMASFRILDPNMEGRGGPATVAIKHGDVIVENLSLRFPNEVADLDTAIFTIAAGIPERNGWFYYDYDEDTVVVHWPVDETTRRPDQNVYDDFMEILAQVRCFAQTCSYHSSSWTM